MKKIILILLVALAVFCGWANRPEKSLYHSSNIISENFIQIRYLGMDDCVLMNDARFFVPIPDGKEKWTLSEFVDDAKKSRGYEGKTGSTLREHKLEVINVLRKFKKTISVGDIYFVNIVPKDSSRTIEVVLEIKVVDKGWATDFSVHPLGYLNGKHSM